MAAQYDVTNGIHGDFIRLHIHIPAGPRREDGAQVIAPQGGAPYTPPTPRYPQDGSYSERVAYAADRGDIGQADLEKYINTRSIVEIVPTGDDTCDIHYGWDTPSVIGVNQNANTLAMLIAGRGR